MLSLCHVDMLACWQCSVDVELMDFSEMGTERLTDGLFPSRNIISKTTDDISTVELSSVLIHLIQMLTYTHQGRY